MALVLARLRRLSLTTLVGDLIERCDRAAVASVIVCHACLLTRFQPLRDLTSGRRDGRVERSRRSDGRTRGRLIGAVRPRVSHHLRDRVAPTDDSGSPTRVAHDAHHLRGSDTRTAFRARRRRQPDAQAADDRIGGGGVAHARLAKRSCVGHPATHGAGRPAQSRPPFSRSRCGDDRMGYATGRRPPCRT